MDLKTWKFLRQYKGGVGRIREMWGLDTVLRRKSTKDSNLKI